MAHPEDFVGISGHGRLELVGRNPPICFSRHNRIRPDLDGDFRLLSHVFFGDEGKVGARQSRFSVSSQMIKGLSDAAARRRRL